MKDQDNVYEFLNRDVSWITFNDRVLDEAEDPGNPLLERLNFIAICSSNLDEFCMVRLAGVASQLSRDYHTIYKEYGYEPKALMQTLKKNIRSLVERQERLLQELLLPEMERKGIRICSMETLTPAQKRTAVQIMSKEIFPVLTPIGIDPSHPFPLVPNLGLEMLIRLELSPGGAERFAILEVPSVIPRFIQLESSSAGLTYIPAEDLIRNQLEMLFPGAKIRECSCFRVTRDMDFSIEEEAIADLMTELQSALRKKTKRSVVRLEYSSKMSSRSREWLLKQLAVSEENALVQPVDTLLNLKNMFELASISRFPELRNEPMEPLTHPLLADKGKSIFRIIREKGPLLLHHPYHSFDPVVNMLQEAADDPQVLAIKQTLYRVSGDSPVVHALIRAARNGKQVSVLVELKARFDEENNINWARSLAEAGAHVVYGVANLKVHCKALMVIRKEEEGIHRYVHLSTGNYNDKTARLYTDLGYFSDDVLLAKDVSSLFNVITGFSTPPQWNKLLVAPFDMLEKIFFLIDREAAYSTKQNPGHIRIKINSLIDYEVMEHLYRAAEKHVKIELIVRGICGITPYSLPAEYGNNIRIVSILDRFLEHERIYYFANNGGSEYYLGSADLMSRNLRKRIELLFPVDDPSLRRELDFILETNLADKRKGRTVCGINEYTKPHEKPVRENTRSQIVLYDFYRKRSQPRQKFGEKPLTVFRDKTIPGKRS